MAKNDQPSTGTQRKPKTGKKGKIELTKESPARAGGELSDGELNKVVGGEGPTEDITFVYGKF
jgi:hypothetical protein